MSEATMITMRITRDAARNLYELALMKHQARLSDLILDVDGQSMKIVSLETLPHPPGAQAVPAITIIPITS